ncbi:MAG: hypothetical protein FWD29_08895 [Micrococcales bacterium]|nr:hypothetical protein [Micrococcales bacterium]
MATPDIKNPSPKTWTCPGEAAEARVFATRDPDVLAVMCADLDDAYSLTAFSIDKNEPIWTIKDIAGSGISMRKTPPVDLGVGSWLVGAWNWDTDSLELALLDAKTGQIKQLTDTGRFGFVGDYTVLYAKGNRIVVAQNSDDSDRPADTMRQVVALNPADLDGEPVWTKPIESGWGAPPSVLLDDVRWDRGAISWDAQGSTIQICYPWVSASLSCEKTEESVYLNVADGSEAPRGDFYTAQATGPDLDKLRQASGIADLGPWSTALTAPGVYAAWGDGSFVLAKAGDSDTLAQTEKLSRYEPLGGGYTAALACGPPDERGYQDCDPSIGYAIWHSESGESVADWARLSDEAWLALLGPSWVYVWMDGGDFARYSLDDPGKPEWTVAALGEYSDLCVVSGTHIVLGSKDWDGMSGTAGIAIF